MTTSNAIHGAQNCLFKKRLITFSMHFFLNLWKSGMINVCWIPGVILCIHTHICTRRHGPSSRWVTSSIHSMWGCCTGWTWRCGRYAPPPTESSRAQVHLEFTCIFPFTLICILMFLFGSLVYEYLVIPKSKWKCVGDWLWEQNVFLPLWSRSCTYDENEKRLTMSVSFFLRFLRSGLGACCSNKKRQKQNKRYVLVFIRYFTTYVSVINKY